MDISNKLKFKKMIFFSKFWILDGNFGHFKKKSCLNED